MHLSRLSGYIYFYKNILFLPDPAQNLLLVWLDPVQHFPPPEVYILASEGRVYGVGILFVFNYGIDITLALVVG